MRMATSLPFQVTDQQKCAEFIPGHKANIDFPNSIQLVCVPKSCHKIYSLSASVCSVLTMSYTAIRTLRLSYKTEME